MLENLDSKSQFSAKSDADLYLLKEITNLDYVKISTHNYAAKGLLLNAFRYALFAVKTHGEIIVDTEAHSSEQKLVPGGQNLPTVVALAKKALLWDCEFIEDPNPKLLRFRRLTEQCPKGWSAAVMFSGHENEVAKVGRCLEGLFLQPELLGADGEIAICGPESGRRFFEYYKNVKYLPYENKSISGSFEISKKKNHVLRQLRHYRKLVIHSRIILEADALGRVPSDFDIVSPNVFFRGPLGKEPHPCFICIDPSWPIGPITRSSYSTTHVRPQKYMKLLSKGRAYADGGAFAVTERVIKVCSLDEDLNWGECEDVEWCLRAQNKGFAVDLVPEFRAVNTATKVRSLGILPAFMARMTRRIKAKLEAY